MSRKLVGKFENDNRIVRVYRDSEWNEYQAELSVCGQKMPDHTYFTEDKNDALSTAQKIALEFWRIKAE